MAGVGLEYRYPFVSDVLVGHADDHADRPARSCGRTRSFRRIQPNEDAQSLVFDETNLFAWNKFSGYDRIEGGTRLNYGFQYTANFANGGHANVVAGQSIQVAGQNSYTLYDIANTGLESGLDKTFSNFVAGETLQPTSAPDLVHQQAAVRQFDLPAGPLRRHRQGDVGGVTASVDYARYAAQPALGWAYPTRGPDEERILQVPRSLVGRRIARPRHVAALSTTLPGKTTLIFYPVGYSFGLRLQGRMHHLHGPVLVEPQRAGRVSGICGRTGRRQPGRPQPDADVPAGPADARRRQGECRPLTGLRLSRPEPGMTRRQAPSGDDDGRPGRHRSGTGDGRLARPLARRRAVLSPRRARASCRARPAARFRRARSSKRSRPRPPASSEGASRSSRSRARSTLSPAGPTPATRRRRSNRSRARCPLYGEGEASAVVTNPIAKSVLYGAGFRFPGHTEFLGELAKAWGDARLSRS